MRLELDWVSLFNLIGAINGIFVASVILGIRKGNRTTSRILAALVFSYALIVFNTVFRQTRIYLYLPWLIGLLPHLYMLFGPLLYFYVRAQTTPRFVFRARHMLHLIPFGLSVAFLVPYYFRDAAAKIATYESLALHTSIAYHVLLVLRILHISVYLILTLKLLKAHQANIIDTHSSLDKIKLAWIRHLIAAIGLLLAAYLVYYVFSLKAYGTVDPCSYRERFFTIWQTLLLFFIGYKGLVQPDIFSPANGSTGAEKYSRSSLTPAMAAAHLDALIRYMEKEKPYLESELTIKQLARHLSIPYLHLSQVINERLNKNFYHFINQYRVEEAKRQLAELRNRPGKTILAVAHESGFNSKSSFNLVFKQFVKLTPSQYMKNF